MENMEQTTNETNVIDASKIDVVAPKTFVEQLNELFAERKKIALAQSEITDETSVEYNDFEDKRFEINKQIKNVQSQIESENKRLKHENELNEYLNMINVLLNAHDAYHNFPDDVDSVEYKNAMIEYNDVYNKIKTELSNQFNNVKRVVHVPMGTTGEQLKKTQSVATTPTTSNGDSKNAQIKRLMDGGKSNDEIIAMGYLDGTVRYARWEWNKVPGNKQTS